MNWDELAADAPAAEDVERRRTVSAAQSIVATQPVPAAPPPPSWADLTKDAPSTQELLSDPARAAQVADDVKGLSFLEDVFGGAGAMLTGGIGDAIYRGNLNDRIALIGYRQALGLATPEELAEADRLEVLAAGVPRPKTGLAARGLRAAAESAPMMAGSAVEAGPAAVGGAAVGGVIGGAAAAVATGGAGVGAGALAGAKFGANVGARAGMTLAMGKREMGSAYREYIQIPGVTPEQAMLASTFVGAANGALEVLPLDIVFQVPALKSLLKGGVARDVFRAALRSNTGRAAVARAAVRLAGGMTLEGLTEAAQELTTIFGGQVIDQKDGVSIDWSRVVEAGVEGALAGGVYGTPGVAAGVRADVSEANRARDRAQFFTALGQAAAESSTVQNLPDVARAHVEAIQARQGGAVESVSAPAEQLLTLFQANDITLDQVARRMPAVARQLEEAAGNPAVEITIPTADFAVNVAPLKGYEGLVPDLRVGDELTLREAEKVEKDAKALAEKDEKGTKPEASPEQRVLADVAAKLEAAGQDPDQARTNAALWSAFSRTMAARTGAGDAWSYYQGLGLEVAQEDIGLVPLEEGVETLAQPTAPVEVVEHDEGLVLSYPGQPLKLNVDREPDLLRATVLDPGVKETKDQLQKVGGQGYSTALYIRALREAQQRGMGFASYRFRSPATEIMYARLKKLGVPFVLEDGVETLSAEVLAELDLDLVERTNEAEAEIQRLRGEKPTVLNQPPAREGAQVRGYVAFPASREWFKVTLTGSANLSTFIHESGHVFLEALRVGAEKNETLKADLAAVHEWLGVPLGGAFQVEQLERFARGFEAYLREGKAPAASLVDVFESMRAWLLHVYQTLRGLNVELTDEVRGVMDRLLATEAEITQARTEAGIVPAFKTAEEAGMSAGEFETYRRGWESAARSAQASVEQRSLEALRRTLGEERAAVREDVQELALLEPVFNLREFLRTGARLDGQVVDEAVAGAKLDRASLEGLADPKALRRLRPYMAAEGGISADDLAPYFGMKNGYELVQALVSTPRRDAWVKAEVDRRMAERYPDGQIANLAKMSVKEVHDTEGLVTSMRREMDAAGKRIAAGPGRTTVETLRRAARERVARMTDLELQPGKYRRAEATASAEFVKAMAGKKWAEAYDAKWRQLWSHFASAETAKAKEEVERIRGYLRGFEDIGTRKRIGKAGQRYLEALDALIDGIQLRKESGKAVRKRASLSRYVAETEAEGDTVSPALKEMSELKSWRSMTVEELQGVEAAAANIHAMARLKGKLLLAGEKRDLARTAAELSEHVKANLGDGAKPTPGDLGKLEKAREWLRSADADMKKVEFLARMMDGGKTAGLAHSLLFQPLRDAQNARSQLNEQVHGALMAPFQALDLSRRKRYAEKVGFLYSAKAGKMVSLTRRNVLTVALNLGNAGNAERLLAGYGWKREEVLARLDQLLDDGDLAIVEHVWKTVDSLWPAMKALSERHVGLPPARVEATPFQLPGGRKLSGGYYPIVKSRRMSYLGQQLAEREAALWEANFFAPVVEHGFTKSRGRDMSPLELSLDVVPAHLDKVIHYLTHYEAIRGVDKLLQQGDVREAITEGLGREYFNTFRPWLENIASDGNLAEPLIWYERAFRSLRFGSSVVLLFGKIPTGVKQALGFFTSGKELRRRHMVSGLRKFLSQGWAEVREQSPEFKFIDKQLDRDARELFTALESSFTELGGLRRKVVEFGAMPIMLVQKTVNAITWYAAKEQALEEGHANPNAYADSIVSMTQTGGGAKDLAAIQRGGELRKLFTVMFSYRSVLYNLLTERTGEKGAKALQAHAARFFWLIFLPVVAEQLLMNGVGDDEDADDVAKRLALEMALLPVTTVPVVGDAVQGAVQGRPPRGAPWVDTIYRSVAAAGKLVQGDDLGKADVRAVVDLVGSTMQLPTGGLWNLTLFTDQLLDGELEEPVQDLLFRNPSKWE